MDLARIGVEMDPVQGKYARELNGYVVHADDGYWLGSHESLPFNRARYAVLEFR